MLDHTIKNFEQQHANGTKAVRHEVVFSLIVNKK